MLADIELKRAVYNALHDLGLNVSNGLPINEQIPYVQMGDLTFSHGATKDTFGGGYELTLHIWCSAYQDIEFHEMMDIVCEALTLETLPLPNKFELGDAKITLLTTLKDELNGQPINHGVIQIEFSILS